MTVTAVTAVIQPYWTPWRSVRLIYNNTNEGLKRRPTIFKPPGLARVSRDVRIAFRLRPIGSFSLLIIGGIAQRNSKGNFMPEGAIIPDEWPAFSIPTFRPKRAAESFSYEASWRFLARDEEISCQPEISCVETVYRVSNRVFSTRAEADRWVAVRRVVNDLDGDLDLLTDALIARRSNLVEVLSMD